MTHPGDFTDTTLAQNLVTASKVAWERPVREISLSARADTTADMADVWQTYVTHLTTIAEQFRDLWKHDLSDSWSGDAAEACRKKWIEVTTQFFKVVENYGTAGSAGTGVPGLLRDTAAAIHDAIGAIPIPVFGSTTANGAVLPNTTTVTKDNDSGWGDQLYADYAAGPHSYEDRAFLKIAESGATEQRNRGAYGNIPAGSRLRPASGSEYDVGDSHEGTTNYQSRQDGTYLANVQAWYISNQRLAHTSYNTLLNTYAKHQTAVPDRVLWDRRPASPKASPPHGTGPTGIEPTGAALAGTAGPGAASRVLPGATTHPNGPMPTSDAGSLSGVTSDPSSSLSGVGGSGPAGRTDPGLGAVAGPDLGSSSGSGFGGSGGAGTVPGVRFSPAFGTSPDEGTGVLPDPLGRASSGLAGEGMPATRNPTGSSGLGMMGSGYGGGAGQERDESRSWLTEDQDIWGLNDKPDMAPPDGVI
jgi:hypothetical protein